MGVPAVPMCPNTFSLDKPGGAALAATPCAARYQELPTASDLQELCLDRYLRVTVVPLQPVRDPSEPAARPWLVRYVSERLKWHGICPAGWQPDACVKDGSCVQKTPRSVTVTGRCLGS